MTEFAKLIDAIEQGIMTAETMDAAARAAHVANIEAAIGMIADGIYFDIPDVVYHGVRRMSASGLQKICVSPANWWAGSWLDPDRPELDEESTKAQILGKAYHCARLEPDAFPGRYVRQPSKDELPEGSLTNGTGIEAALAALGLPKKQADDGGVLGQAMRLAAAGFDKPIWHIVEAEWEAQRMGRIPIAAEFFDQIMTDMERIQDNDDIAPLLSGGFAEVSIFWTDEHGIPMKARIDYLTALHWADLKSYANSKGMEVEQCIAQAVQYNRYHVQARTYLDAVEAIRQGGLPVIYKRSAEQQALIDAIAAQPGELDCHYIFQEKGGVPNLFDYEFPFFDVPPNNKVNDAGATPEQIAAVARATRTKTGLHGRAIKDIDKAKRDFVMYSQIYEPGQPWRPIDPNKRLGDNLFSPRWLEGEY